MSDPQRQEPEPVDPATDERSAPAAPDDQEHRKDLIDVPPDGSTLMRGTPD